MMQTKTSLAILAVCTTAFLAALVAFTPSGAAQVSDSALGRQHDSSSQIRTPAPIEVPVSGLTEGNAAKVVSLLESMQRNGPTEWKCETCDVKQAQKGLCPKCKTALVESRSQVQVLREVKADAGRGVITFAIAPKQIFDTDELARLLLVTEVTVKQRDLAVPAFARLDIVIPAEANEAERQIREALERAQLFKSVSVRIDNSAGRSHVVVESGAKLATFAAVATAVEKVGDGFRLSGLGWAGPCDACSKLEHKTAACAACWNEAQPRVSKSGH